MDALATILNDVAEKPFDFQTHIHHVLLADSIEGMHAEATAAREMMSQFLAVGDDVWLPLLGAKEAAVDLETEQGVQDLLALYARAEADYLSIPILQKHIQFLIERHEHYASEENLRPQSLGDQLFTTAWTREALDSVVEKGLIHLTESRKLWDVYKDWEFEILEAAPSSEKPQLVDHVKNLLLLRLQQTHSNMEDTFQSYSSFTTNHEPPQEYEKLLIAASKLRGQSVRNYDRREPLESALSQSQNSLEAFQQYILYERRAKHPDVFVTQGVYERAIAEAARRRFRGEQGAEEALRVFWNGYCDALRILEVGIDVELETYRRAARSIPGSGDLWARYMRFLERLLVSGESIEGVETISDVFDGALSKKLVQSDISQLIPIILARAGYEKRLLEAGSEDEDALPSLIGLLESGIEMTHRASKTIDPTLRLEKYLASVYENSGLTDSVFDVWAAAAKHAKGSYQVWLAYTDALIKHQKHSEARQIFTDVHTKQIDWPEAVWEAWTAFEHLHGSVLDIERCLDKVEKARYQTDMRRAKEAEKAAYQAMQEAAAAQANVPVASAPVPDLDADVVPMQVDPSSSSASAPSDRRRKRGAEDDEDGADAHKKARIEQKAQPLKRDRENSTVFVADLPGGVNEEDLKGLFKDCGSVREVKITQLTGALVATVEFFDRDNVPAALTKDKKRLRGEEISVHLAWKSTLYVTNFPESADDPFIRNLFGKYGIIFDVRWPSKKFKTTRRFCYVQFTSPNAAQKALELHGRELEPNLPLSVLVSNPERKKERTDADANEREVYVAGLSRFANKEDLEKLFATYGPVKDVRIALDDAGHARGYAFVEFEEANDTQRALGANNYELKKRRIGVTLADPRVRARHKSDIGLSRVAEARSRSVYIRNLPPATQEGLLQQVLEKIVSVKRVEVFIDKQEAVVELENPAEAGRLLLRPEPIEYGGNVLELSDDPSFSRPKGHAKGAAAAAAAAGPALFKPRNLGPSKPKTGLGFRKGPVVVGRGEGSSAGGGAGSAAGGGASGGGAKGQDDFRKMLEKK